MQISTKATENSFNAVRLLAALEVAYVHAIAWLKITPPWGYGWITQFPGVPIFFAVSGYLVFDSLLRLQSIKKFAAHRATRIYPALAVNILIIEVALYAFGQIDFNRSLPAVWAFFFFISYVLTASYELASQWVGSGGGKLSFDGFFQIYPSGVLWTLTVELTFYAAVPIIGLMKGRISQTVLIVAASLASLAFQQYLGPDPRSLITISFTPYFWIFGIGMLVRLWPPPQRSLKICALALASVYFGILYWHWLPWFEWKTYPSISAIVQTIILSLLALFVGLSPLLKSRWLANNDASYGLYLYHMLIVTALMNVPQGHRSQWLILAVLAGAYFAGLLSWWLVERPAMNLVRLKRDSLHLPQVSSLTPTSSSASS